jgi:hypothetical protein
MTMPRFSSCTTARDHFAADADSESTSTTSLPVNGWRPFLAISGFGSLAALHSPTFTSRSKSRPMTRGRGV